MLPCCWRSENSAEVTNGKKKKSFDDQLLEGFRDVLHRGGISLGSDPENIQHRTIAGKLGVVVRLPGVASLNAGGAQEQGSEPKNGALSNGNAAAAAAAALPTDAERSGPSKVATNFSQVQEVEKVAVLDGSTLVLPSRMPLAIGDVLVVPRYTEVLPHVLTKDILVQALDILSKSESRDFRLLFDSRAAAATDHCHFHGLFLSHCGFPDSLLPVEKIERSLVAGSTREGSASIDLLLETRWEAHGFVVCSGPRKGAVGLPPLADTELLASVAFRLLTEIQQKGFAYSVLIGPCREQSKGRRSLDIGLEEEPMSMALSPEIYIFPLQQKEQQRDSAAGLTSWEVGGLLIAFSVKDFADMTEDSLTERLKAVSVSGADFDDLICKAAWI